MRGPEPRAISRLTAMFMHAGWDHLLGNVLLLAILGKKVEEAIGRLRYPAFRLDRRTGAARHATNPPSVHGATVGARAALNAAMREVALYVAATAGALLLGAALGCFRTPPTRLTAGMLAFAAGALIVAVAFELFEPAHRQAGLARASAALLVGAATFVAVDLLLERYAGADAVGLALVAAVTLDGVPENLALGVGLAESGSYALLAAIVVSNLPEAFGGAAHMRQGGLSSARVLAVWGLTAALLAVALVAGRLAADVASEQWLGMLAAFAAGAVLASLADSVMPEAYAEGGPLVAFATSGGFLVAYALTTLD